MLLHFQGELGRIAVHLVLEFEGVINSGHFLFAGKFHVHNRTDDLNDVSFIHKCD